MPFTFFGSRRKFWNSPHSPWPTVAPNDAGCWSDMSKTTFFAFAIASAVARVVASGKTLDGTCLLPVAKPPYAAHASAAAGVPRKFTNDSIAGLSRNVTIVSPPISTDGGELLIDGNGNSP